jgi:streptogramin lyase
VAKIILGLIGIFVILISLSATASAAVFANGDVFTGEGAGKIGHYDKLGNFIEYLNVPNTGYTETGMAFDASGNLYSALFQINKLAKIDNNGAFLDYFGSGYNSDPESIVLDNSGNFYVGQADGSRDILKFDPSGILIDTFNPATTDRGTDWIDLAQDQKTIYYTSEGSTIKRFDVNTSTQLPDFATDLLKPCFALRIRNNGEVMVACQTLAYRLDSSGAVIKTYPKPAGDTFLFALNLDPDGTSFWTGDALNGKAHKIDIDTGNVLLTIDTPSTQMGGLAVFGEQTAAVPSGSISGKKYNDADGNGQVNGGEIGFKGWTITLKDAQGKTITTTTTNSNGDYTFGSLQAGTYIVGEGSQSGWTQTAPSGGTYTVTIARGEQKADKDFLNLRNTPQPPVPELPTIALMGLGVFGLLMMVRREQ